MRIDRRIKTSPRRIYTFAYRAARLKFIAPTINFFLFFFQIPSSKGVKKPFKSSYLLLHPKNLEIKSVLATKSSTLMLFYLEKYHSRNKTHKYCKLLDKLLLSEEPSSHKGARHSFSWSIFLQNTLYMTPYPNIP